MLHIPVDIPKCLIQTTIILGNDLEISLSCSANVFSCKADVWLVGLQSHMQFLNKCSHCGQYFKSSILSAEVDCFSWSAGNKNILRSCSDLPG